MRKRRPGRLRGLDYIVILAAAAVTAGSFVFTAAGDGSRLVVEVRSPQGTWLYPLKTDLALPPVGPPGTCEILIREGRVGVTASDCPQKICISMSPVSQAGTWIACLPHQVFIRVKGGPGAGEVDAVVN